MSWFIEFDISKYFDTINRQILFKLLAKKIQDQALFDLLHKFFNTKTIGLQSSHTFSRQGIPQGCILSPLLANIYLHELDKEIIRIKDEYQTNKLRRRDNTEFLKETRISRIDRRNLSKAKLSELRKEKLSNAYKKGLVRTDIKDPSYIKVNYIRYADDFLIGFSGPKSTALKIKKRIIFYLQSSLHLKVNEYKTKLVHAFSDKVTFLGFDLQYVKPKHRPVLFTGDIRQIRKSAVKMKNHIDKLMNRKEKKERDLVNKVLYKLAKKNSIDNKAKLKKNIREISINLFNNAIIEQGFKNNFLNTLTEYFMTSASRILSSDDPGIKEVKENIEVAINSINLISKPDRNKLHKLKLDNANNAIDKHKSKGNINSIKTMYIEGKRYSLPLQIKVDMKKIVNKFYQRGIVDKKGRPLALRRIFRQDPILIITYFNSIAYGILSFYACSDNFYRIKSFVNYQLRWSLLHTLATKYKTSINKLNQKFPNLVIYDNDKEVKFIPMSRVNNLKKEFLINVKEFD